MPPSFPPRIDAWDTVSAESSRLESPTVDLSRNTYTVPLSLDDPYHPPLQRVLICGKFQVVHPLLQQAPEELNEESSLRHWLS
jgi:hypothetical protein